MAAHPVPGQVGAAGQVRARGDHRDVNGQDAGPVAEQVGVGREIRKKGVWSRRRRSGRWRDRRRLPARSGRGSGSCVPVSPTPPIQEVDVGVPAATLIGIGITSGWAGWPWLRGSISPGAMATANSRRGTRAIKTGVSRIDVASLRQGLSSWRVSSASALQTSQAPDMRTRLVSGSFRSADPGAEGDCPGAPAGRASAIPLTGARSGRQSLGRLGRRAGFCRTFSAGSALRHREPGILRSATAKFNQGESHLP
jgi:hypothetical protein